MTDQIIAASNLMVRDYIILAFLVSLGALQIAVSISGICGLWLIPNQLLTRILGIILIALGLALYIFSPLWLEGPWAAGSVVDGTSADRVWGTATLSEISGARNLNDIHGGMAGTAYAGFFIVSAVLATLFAAAIGTINLRLFRPTLSASFERAPQNHRVSPAGRMLENSRVSPAQRGKCPKDKGGNHVSTDPNLCGGATTDGLDALKNNNPLTTFKSSVRNLRLTGANDIRAHMQSTHRWSIPAQIERMWRN